MVEKLTFREQECGILELVFEFRHNGFMNPILADATSIMYDIYTSKNNRFHFSRLILSGKNINNYNISYARNNNKLTVILIPDAMFDNGENDKLQAKIECDDKGEVVETWYKWVDA